ncbi:MAG: VOC family protein [Thermoplasmata archaeon]
MEPRISLVTLGVSDLRRSVKFYQDDLGWNTTFTEGDPIAFFRLRGLVLGLYERRALAADVNVSPEGNGFRGITLAHNVRSRRAVVAIFARLRRRGASIVKPPRATDWGGFSGYFADPDNHLWEVAHNPGWKLDRNGAVVLPK